MNLRELTESVFRRCYGEKFDWDELTELRNKLLRAE